MRYNENKIYYLPCLRYSSRFILSATKSNCNNCNTRFREINTFLTGSIEIRAFLTFHSQNLCLNHKIIIINLNKKEQIIFHD